MLAAVTGGGPAAPKMVQLQQPPQPGDPPTATPSRRRASNASYGNSGSQCMPWMVGVTLLQTVLLIGIVTKLALVVVRWEHDHTAHRHGDSRSVMRRDFEGGRSGLGKLLGSRGRGGARGSDGGRVHRRWGQHDYGEAGADGDYAGDDPVAATGAGAGEGAGGGLMRRHGEAAGGRAAGEEEEDKARIYHEQVSIWPYTCWTPREGMSNPRLTIVTVIDGLPKRYRTAIWNNRMHYAARHGHRYCELQMHDRNKIPAFSKLPWILSLAPCTDFIIHLDADAIINDQTLSLSPWIQFMQAKNVDQLFSADCIVDSPLNYGVFMVRTASWLWNFYRKIYNICTCDWSRMHDWPAEQGIAYDLIASQMDSFETGRSMIVSGKGWNHILNTPEEVPQPHDVIVHLTWPQSFPTNHSCWDKGYRDNNERKCKYLGLEHFVTTVIGTAQYLPDLNITEHFIEEQNSCQQVRQNSLFVGKTTYSNQHDALPGSVMDFDIDPVSGKVLGVKVGEVGCLGYREKKCSLPYLWDVKKGTGPWEMYPQDIV